MNLPSPTIALKTPACPEQAPQQQETIALALARPAPLPSRFPSPNLSTFPHTPHLHHKPSCPTHLHRRHQLVRNQAPQQQQPLEGPQPLLQPPWQHLVLGTGAVVQRPPLSVTLLRSSGRQAQRCRLGISAQRTRSFPLAAGAHLAPPPHPCGEAKEPNPPPLLLTCRLCLRPPNSGASLSSSHRSNHT